MFNSVFYMTLPNLCLNRTASQVCCEMADEGGIGSGVRRDWLNNMMNSMLDPQTGLFESCDGGHTWQPCPLAHMQEEHLVYFEMLGKLYPYFVIAFCVVKPKVSFSVVAVDCCS